MVVPNQLRVFSVTSIDLKYNMLAKWLIEICDTQKEDKIIGYW